MRQFSECHLRRVNHNKRRPHEPARNRETMLRKLIELTAYRTAVSYRKMRPALFASEDVEDHAVNVETSKV